MRRSGAWAVLVLAISVAACQSTGVGVQPSDLFSMAPADIPTKVVTIEVVCGRGRLMADAGSMAAIERMPGVYAVRRGSAPNVVHVLVDEFARPESIGERLQPDCTGRVLSVERPPAK